MSAKQRAYRFDKITLLKSLKGVLISGGGAVAVPILECISKQDFGKYSPVVGAVSAIAINTIREFIKGDKGVTK